MLCILSQGKTNGKVQIAAICLFSQKFHIFGALGRSSPVRMVLFRVLLLKKSQIVVLINYALYLFDQNGSMEFFSKINRIFPGICVFG